MALAGSPAVQPTLAAQIRASERGSVSQTIDGTTIRIEYGRPRLRQRTNADIFGKEVHWGEVWTPGANRATSFSVDRDVTINGTAVPAGSYSIWIVVDTSTTWNTVLISDTTMFHTEHPEVTAGMIQFSSPASRGGQTVDLTWGFHGIRSTGVTAEMAWADRRVALEIQVAPSLPIDLAAEKAAPFLGEYEVHMTDGSAPEGWDPSMELFHADNALRVRWSVWFWPEMTEEIMVPLTDEWFTFAMAQDGEIFDVIRELTFEFNLKDGKATGFDVRLPNDKVLFSGTRK
jgi:hypothetical protein